MRKSTNKELVIELEAINQNGKLDKFINRAKANYYHDYKQPEHITCGKTLFVSESTNIPELQDLRNRIMNGEFDEEADEEDKAEMRKDLPASMWASFGLNPLN
jgi:hypothetical protein